MANKRNPVKKRKFVMAILKHGNPQQAALDAGYRRSNTGYDLMQDSDVQAKIQYELEKAGLGTNQLIQEIKKGLENGKLGSHKDYLGMAFELHGHMKKNEVVGGPTFNIAVLGDEVERARRARGLPL